MPNRTPLSLKLKKYKTRYMKPVELRVWSFFLTTDSSLSQESFDVMKQVTTW